MKRFLCLLLCLCTIVSMVVLCASTLPDWRAAAADNRSLDDRSRYSAGPGREPSG